MKRYSSFRILSLHSQELDGALLAAVRDILRFCLRSVSPVNSIYVEKVVYAWGLMAGTSILCESFVCDIFPPFLRLS